MVHGAGHGPWSWRQITRRQIQNNKTVTGSKDQSSRGPGGQLSARMAPGGVGSRMIVFSLMTPVFALHLPPLNKLFLCVPRSLPTRAGTSATLTSFLCCPTARLMASWDLCSSCAPCLECSAPHTCKAFSLPTFKPWLNCPFSVRPPYRCSPLPPLPICLIFLGTSFYFTG